VFGASVTSDDRGNPNRIVNSNHQGWPYTGGIAISTPQSILGACGDPRDSRDVSINSANSGGTPSGSYAGPLYGIVLQAHDSHSTGTLRNQETPYAVNLMGNYLTDNSLGQVGKDAIAPSGIAGQRNVQVVITQWAQTVAQAVSNAFTVPETDSSIAVFNGPPGGNRPSGVQTCNVQSCTPNTASNPAPAGSVIVLYATAGGMWNNRAPDGSISILGQQFDRKSVSLTVGGQPAANLYAGVPPVQRWSLFQVNALVPEGLAAGPQSVVLRVGEADNTSRQVTLFIQ
jgi:uncharacterized protein (TIGR03437 family)